MNEKTNEANSARSWIHDGDTEWYAANGYTNPEEMIDHNGNLNRIQPFMDIFIAYNQHNIANGTPWDTWPSWELCLTDLDYQGYAIINSNDSEDVWQKRAQWLAVMQYLHDTPEVTWEEYTFTVQGNHGTTFTFDFSLELQSFVRTGGMAEHERLVSEGKHHRSWKGGMVYAAQETITHNLGAYWQVPDHVPGWGGQASTYLAEESFQFCQHAGFPLNLMSAVAMCIDDTRIWLMQMADQIHEQVRIEWWEKNWPMGRPEDIDCQYSKEDWVEIRAEWQAEANRRMQHGVKKNE